MKGSMSLITLLTALSINSTSLGRENRSPRKPTNEPSATQINEANRRWLLGLDIGAGVFTGGLGTSNTKALYLGIHGVFSISKVVAIEGAVHYASHSDVINSASGTLKMDAKLIPITAGMRFYLNSPAVSESDDFFYPYLAVGSGLYLRSLTTTESTGLTLVDPDPSEKSVGLYAGAGLSVPVYKRTLFLGADVRYHLIIFSDESSTLGGALPADSRAGDYFTPSMTLNYNF